MLERHCRRGFSCSSVFHPGSGIFAHQAAWMTLSPAGPQDLTLTTHMLVPTSLCPTFFLKLFFLAYLLIQAKVPRGIAPRDGNRNYPASNTDCLDKELWRPTPPRPVSAPPPTSVCAEAPWSDPCGDWQLPSPHYSKISTQGGAQASFT